MTTSTNPSLAELAKKRDEVLGTGEEWLTLKEVAEFLKVHYQTAWQLMTDGKFPSAIQRGQGGAWRIPTSDIDLYLDSISESSE